MSERLQVLVGLRIAEARRSTGMSQSQLARAVEGATRTVQSWESGSRSPRGETLQRISTITGHPVSWFYTAPEEIAAA
jgi:DNA-binding transcriptional regulator YiaG